MQKYYFIFGWSLLFVAAIHPSLNSMDFEFSYCERDKKQFELVFIGLYGASLKLSAIFADHCTDKIFKIFYKYDNTKMSPLREKNAKFSRLKSLRYRWSPTEEERNELHTLLLEFNDYDYKLVEKLALIEICCRLLGPILIGITHFILYRRLFKCNI